MTVRFNRRANLCRSVISMPGVHCPFLSEYSIYEPKFHGKWKKKNSVAREWRQSD